MSKWREALTLPVLIAGLGYFVDMFDITLFGVVRVASLRSLQVPEAEILSAGISIYNAQMIGLMIGGILWGILGDKRGRLSVLFGSILIYSIGNIANAFVWDVNSYVVCRFITGVGLAGELGAAVTLVAESLPIAVRGVGTTIVASLGLFGCVVAAFVGQMIPWKTSYILGGVMGLCLLATRFKMFESGLFEKSAQSSNHLRGDVRLLFSRSRFSRYVRCILIGAPIYFITGVLFTFSPELTQSLELTGPVSAGSALLWGSIGLTVGDVLIGFLSQILKSRIRAVVVALVFAAFTSVVYLNSFHATPEWIYLLCFFTGTFAGYWAVLVTLAAEQFGTNVRATVATTVPNFVRGSAVISTSCFGLLKGTLSPVQAALVIGSVTFILAIASAVSLRDTFSKDLDFLET